MHAIHISISCKSGNVWYVVLCGVWINVLLGQAYYIAINIAGI